MSDAGERRDPSSNFTLTRVPGVSVGSWNDPGRTTGVTVVLLPDGARAGAAILGSAAGTRQTGVFDPSHVTQTVHGICLAGGSAFGLGAAEGVMEYLESRGIGFDSGFGIIPVVPAAVIFDLRIAKVRPTAQAGREAAAAAAMSPVDEGRVGAGAGATVAKWVGGLAPGGQGSCARDLGGWTVGALAVVNAVGSIRDHETGAWIAGGAPSDEGRKHAARDWDRNTTLVVVATDAPLLGAQATLVARMASAGLARTIYPAFTPFDGDVVFAVSTGAGEPVGRGVVADLGNVAADVVARSIVRAVRSAAPGGA